MASRVSEKQRRRAVREAAERAAALRERRSRRLWIAGATTLAVAVLVAVGAVIAGSGGHGAAAPASASASETAFGPHYAGLEQRRLAARVSTMASPTSSDHIHQQLAVWVDGKQIGVPANIGVDPGRPAGDMASLHTHTPDGEIHDEGQADATLGQFFAVWGVAFGRDRLGPYRPNSGQEVSVWVDGRPSRASGALKLSDGQRIVVAFGPPRTSPPGS